MEQFDTTARIAVLETEVRNIATSLGEIRAESKEQHAMLMAKMNQLDDRIAIVERWRWMVVGGAAVAGYIFAHFVK